MQLQETTVPMSPAERSLVDRVKAYTDTDDLGGLAAGHGFRLAASPGWCDTRPRGAYQTYARAKGGRLTLLRNVSLQTELPPWRLVMGDPGSPEFELDHSGHFDLWPAEAEDEDRPISGAAVFGLAAVGIFIILALAWATYESGLWSWPW